MGMAKRKYVRKPKPEDVRDEICPICQGKGFTEHGQGGILRRKCICGTLSVEERIGIIPERTGQIDRDSGGEDTGEPEVSKEPEADEGVSGATEELLPEVRDGVPLSEDREDI